MKRNRLTRSSTQANIFSNTASKINKRYRLLALSLLSFVGIFITSMVLATSNPISGNTESQVIDLPNLPAEMQSIKTTFNTSSSKSIASLNTNSSPTMAVAIEKNKIDTSFPQLSQGSTLALTEEVNSTDIAALEQDAIEKALTTSLLEDEANISPLTPSLTWQEITVKSGDNLSVIFPRVGLSARDVYNVAQLGNDIKPLLNLKPGQTLRFGFANESEANTLQQVQLQLSPIKTLQVRVTDKGYQVSTASRDVESRQVHTSGIIESSLFEAGIEAGLSDKLVMELAYIFGWDIDFALDLRKDDHFKLIYLEDYLDGDKIADGAILAAEFTNQGKTFKAVRYTDDTGLNRYYSPTGDSMRKAFSRTPVHFSRISSKFNPNRKHPVLKTKRPHKGVDYAAATGTPILATGDGKVDFAGTKGGYGRTVILTHGGKYTTLYAHMSKYKKGIKRGQRVRQGDTIGYIGSSGLATGPHLHYEFRVNGVHRNPLTVALPKAEALPKKYRADFDKKAQPLLAQLDQVNNNTLALNN